MRTWKFLILVCCLSIFFFLVACNPSTDLSGSTASENISMVSHAANAAPAVTRTPQRNSHPPTDTNTFFQDAVSRNSDPRYITRERIGNIQAKICQ